MSAGQHTPGPYTVSGPHIVSRGKPGEFRAFVVEAATPEGNAVLAYVTANGTDLPQARLDAALFGMAPEMFKALDEINAIRNSIVGAQALNWSEHAYPLVAILDRAGFKGLPYPEARQHVGTLLERIATAEQQVAKSFDDATATESLIQELLAALKPLNHEATWDPDGDLTREEFDALLVRAEEAISKAEARP